jgi:hypothetical protein
MGGSRRSQEYIVAQRMLSVKPVFAHACRACVTGGLLPRRTVTYRSTLPTPTSPRPTDVRREASVGLTCLHDDPWAAPQQH